MGHVHGCSQGPLLLFILTCYVCLTGLCFHFSTGAPIPELRVQGDPILELPVQLFTQLACCLLLLLLLLAAAVGWLAGWLVGCCCLKLAEALGLIPLWAPPMTLPATAASRCSSFAPTSVPSACFCPMLGQDCEARRHPCCRPPRRPLADLALLSAALPPPASPVCAWHTHPPWRSTKQSEIGGTNAGKSALETFDRNCDGFNGGGGGGATQTMMTGRFALVPLS